MENLIQELRERRKTKRLPLKLDIFSRDTGKLVGRSLNISTDGMFIETDNILKSGTKVLLVFNLPGQIIPIKAYSDVRWIRKNVIPEEGWPSGIGIQFIGMYEAYKRKLEEYQEKSLFTEEINSDNYTLADFIEISDKDLFTKTKLFWEAIKDMTQKGFNTYRRLLLSACKNRVLVWDEKTGKPREMIMMDSNNYLGLTVDPKMIKATKETIEKYGVGAGSAPLLAGTYNLHTELEAKLAKLTSCDDAVVFPTGYMANIGCISALIKRKDIAIVDDAVHASIIDGCKLSEGSFRTFKHSDTQNLKQVLESSQDKYFGKLIIVEGIYGIDGDMAPLPVIAEVAEEYRAKVMVDDTHAIGVIGEDGRGTISHFKMEGKIDIVMGTLSHALGGMGGFIASSPEAVNYLRYYARSFFFASSLPPYLAASALAAIEVMENRPELNQNLWKNIKYMKENLEYLGFRIGNSQSAIISIIIGNELLLRRMNKRLHEEGIYLSALPYPAVPRGQERLRLKLMATHIQADLNRTLEALEKVGREFGVLGKSCGTYTKALVA